MIGKLGQSKLSPTIQGVMLQSSTYGTTIPRYYGTTMGAPLLTWLNGIREAGSSKKGSKKSGGTTYNACVTMLLGHNPIQQVLRVIAGNVGLGLRNVKTTIGYGSSAYSIVDSNFYVVVGVTVTVPYSVTFADYGAPAGVSLSGSYELPLWNLAMNGPDPTNSSGYRYQPWTYYCLPGSTDITQLPTLSGPTGVNIYYAATVLTGFGAGEFPLPFVMNCAHESSLGDGPEYTDYKDFTAQQIIYPMFGGIGSFNFDLGNGAMPQLRTEVMGAYTLYPDPAASSTQPRADADYADMVEDILKSGQTQGALTSTGIGAATARTAMQMGANCWEFPGAVQKKFWSQAIHGNFAGSMQFDLPVTQGNFLVAAVGSNGGAHVTLSDTLANSWTAAVGSNGVEFFYATANASGTTTLTFGAGAAADSDVQIFEIGGVDTLDAVIMTSASGSSLPSASLTTSSNIGQTGYLLTWVFAGVGAAVGSSAVSRWNPLIQAESQGGNFFGHGTQWSYSEFRQTTAAAKYTFTGTAATSTWFVVMLALKNNVAPSYPKPFGNILDEPSLNQCRLQARANGLFGSLVLNGQRTVADWASDLYTCMNAWPVWSGFKLKSVPLSEVSAVGHGAVYRAATASGPVANLSDLAGDFIGDSGSPLIDVQIKSVLDRPNLLRLQHPDANNNYNQASVPQPNPMGIALNGLRYDSPKKLDMIQHISVSRMVLGILARRQSYLTKTYKFKLNAKWKLLEAGDLVTVNDQYLGVSLLPVRLRSVAENADYTLDCEAEDFSYGIHDPTPLATTESQSNPTGTTTVPAAVNAPVFLEPPLAFTKDTHDQLWIVVSDSDATYGGSQVFVSEDSGISYLPLEDLNGTTLVSGNGVTGATTADWPQALDPDSTNNLNLDLSESLGFLNQYSVSQENNFTYPCYVSGGGGIFPYELMAYSSALLTDTYKYTLQASGGGGGAGVEDILDWVMIGYPLRTTHHYTGASVYSANWLDADGLKFWLIKNTAGHPWDINTYDGTYIYHYITENADTSEPGGSHWGSDVAFKRHEVLVPVMPRFYTPSGGPVTITTPGPNPFTRTIACETDGEPIINLGPTTNKTSGPTNVAFGGDVGTQPTIINSFYYGNQREQFFYCKGVGLVQWQHAHLTSGSPITGVYTVDQTTLHNMLTAGGCPTPDFPCYTSIPGAGFSGSWIGGVPGAGGNVSTPGSGGGTGNALRRAAFGTWASAALPNTGPDHPNPSRFAFLGAGAPGVFKVAVPSAWTGKTLFFKFVQFNAFGAGTGTLAAAVAYSYTVLGTGNTGGTGGGTGGSGGGGSSSYTISPTNPLTNPTATTIVMANVVATFTPSNLQTFYKSRTFTIPTPGAPTPYYVTVYDPTFTGDTGATATLAAFCNTTPTLVHQGQAGYIYMGTITALPAGGGTSGGGGGSNPGSTANNLAVIVAGVAGKPGASQLVAIYTAFSVEVFPANFGAPNQSYGSVGVNPTATATYTVNKNGASVGTVAISTLGAFTFTSAGFTLSPQDRLTIVAPSSPDATLSDVSITLVGTR